MACFGGAIATDDYEQFRSSYSKIVGSCFKSHGYECQKRVYKSYEILHAFDEGPEILSELATELLNLDSTARLDLFLTYFSEEKHPFIYLYPEDRITRKMPVREFVERELSQYYSLVCAREANKREPSVRLLCDAFQGDVSMAWKEMRGKTSFRIVYGGDACEPLIAATDITLKAIDLELEKRGLQLRNEYIENALTSLGCSRQVDTAFVGDIRSLIPLTRKSINFTSELLHPIVFVMPEGLPPLEIEGKKMTEGDVIRNSPKYRDACNLAYEQKGAVKIFEPRDLRTIQSGDFFVPTGKNSRKYAEHLKELGHDIKIV